MCLASRLTNHARAALAAILAALLSIGLSFGLAGIATADEPQPATPSPTAPATAPTPEQFSKALAASKSSTVKVTESWTREVLVTYPDSTIQRKRQLAIVECSGVFVGDSTGVNNGTILTAGHCRDDDAVVKAFDRQIEDLPRGELKPILIMPGMPPMSTDGPASDTQQGGMPTVLNVGDLDVRIQVTQEKGLPGAVITNPVDARPLSALAFENGDQALIKVDGLPYVPAVKSIDRLPADGEEMWTIGYPGSMNEETLGPDIPRSSDILIDPNANYEDPFAGPEGPYDRDPGQLAKDFADSRITVAAFKGYFGGRHYVKGTEYLITSASLAQGMSGGGTFIFDGEQPLLVGLSSYLIEMQAMNLITSPSSTHTFLEANGVQSGNTAVTASSDASSSTDVDNKAAAVPTDTQLLASAIDRQADAFLVLAAVVGAIVITGGTVLILWRRRRPPPQSTTQPEAQVHDRLADAT